MEKIIYSTISLDEMTRKDKKGYFALYTYYLESTNGNVFDIPLFISDEGKGILSVESFKRVFWAFQMKIKKHCTAGMIKSDSEGGSFNIIRITVDKNKTFNPNDFMIITDNAEYIEPKKTDLKRPSSKTTKANADAKAKKAEQAEAEADLEWNKKAVKELSKYLVVKFKIKTSDLNKIEDDIYSILSKIK